MHDHFHYKCFRRTLIGFLNLFNDIKIGKYKDGELAKLIDVPIKFAPKQRFYSWIFDRKHEKRFPMLASEITSIEYDTQRASGKNQKIKINKNEESINYYLNPTPYIINFDLHVATEYMTEMNQIAEQILPFFNPFVYITVDVPEIDDKWNLKVMFDGVNLDQAADISPDEYRSIIWTFSFNVKTFLLKPTGDIKTVRKIIQKLYTTEDTWDYRNNTETESPSGIGHDAEEIFLKGSLDDENKILYDYEIFN